MRTLDAAYLTVACVLPLAGFLRWRLQSPEGPLYQDSAATQDAWSIKFFQDWPLPCPKYVGATATIFVAAQPWHTPLRVPWAAWV